MRKSFRMTYSVCFVREYRVELQLDLTRLSSVGTVSEVGDGEGVGLEGEAEGALCLAFRDD